MKPNYFLNLKTNFFLPILLSLLTFPCLLAQAEPVDIRIVEKSKGIVQVMSQFTEVIETPPVLIVAQDNVNAAIQRNVQPIVHTSAGLGIIVHKSGYVVTSSNNIIPNSSVYIKLKDGSQKEASVVRRADDKNMVLLKFTPSSSFPILDPIANPSLSFDSVLYALANDSKGKPTMVQAKVSGLAMSKTNPGAIELFQIDMQPSPPGGMPLLNKEGRVYGIVMAPQGETGGRIFVIPYRTIYETFKKDVRSAGGVLSS